MESSEKNRKEFMQYEDEGVKQRHSKGTFGINDNIYTMMEVSRCKSARPFEYRVEKNAVLEQNPGYK